MENDTLQLEGEKEEDGQNNMFIVLSSLKSGNNKNVIIILFIL